MASGEHWQDDYDNNHPPAYNATIRFDGATTSSQQQHYHRRQASGLRASKAFDSSRAVANESTRSNNAYTNAVLEDNNGAGIGAGRNAYMAPDTPSMYTDPYEYASNVAGPTNRRGSASGGAANVLGTRPDVNFLQHDPYASRVTTQDAADLRRSNTVNTLGPGDSISSYNLDARSRNLGAANDAYAQDIVEYADQGDGVEDEDGYTHRPYRTSNDYYGDGGGAGGGASSNYHGHGYSQSRQFDASAASLPLKDNAGYMGYADDEEDEKRQRDHYWNVRDDAAGQRDSYWNGEEGKNDRDWNRRHPPSLFANNMQGPAVPRKSVDENDGEDRRGLLGALTGSGAKPGWGGSLEEQIERRQKGIGRQRWPILSWMLSVAYVVVFIIELIKSKSATGQAIQTKPSINPMIGPPFEFLISFGARFVPCMRKVPDVPLTTQLVCLKDSALSTVSSSQACPLYEICGLPNATTYGQSYRFITPIFLHAGFVHIGFNLLAQLTLGSQIEKIFSSPVFAVVFMAGGIGGNLLGGNFGLVGLPSVGASGAIYACISLELTDLLYNWRYEHRPMVRLVASIVFTIIGFAIGLLPGLDNFAHIGGFAVGLLGGAMLGPSIHETRRHRIITWIVRVVAAGLLVGFFVGLATNFYNSEDPSKACTWCRYLSCLPVFSQCKGNGLTVSTQNTSSRRAFEL